MKELNSYEDLFLVIPSNQKYHVVLLTLAIMCCLLSEEEAEMGTCKTSKFTHI